MSQLAPTPVEPSQPEERDARDLPPKSYAEAAEEATILDADDQGTDGTSENKKNIKAKKHANGKPTLAEPSQPEEREARDLPPKSYAEAAEEGLTDESKDQKARNIENIQANGKIKIPTHEEKDYYELEGAGQDNSPKSPTARGHRRKSSLRSNGSVGRKHGEQLTNGTLTSFKPGSDEDDSTLRSRDGPPMKRRDSTLKSGRQAGAGWHRSKYVTFQKDREDKGAEETEEASPDPQPVLASWDKTSWVRSGVLATENASGFDPG